MIRLCVGLFQLGFYLLGMQGWPWHRIGHIGILPVCHLISEVLYLHLLLSTYTRSLQRKLDQIREICYMVRSDQNTLMKQLLNLDGRLIFGRI